MNAKDLPGTEIVKKNETVGKNRNTVGKQIINLAEIRRKLLIGKAG